MEWNQQGKIDQPPMVDGGWRSGELFAGTRHNTQTSGDLATLSEAREVINGSLVRCGLGTGCFTASICGVTLDHRFASDVTK